MHKKVLIILALVAACGRAEPPAPMQPVEVVAAAPQPKLAIAIEGDVRQKDESTFIATGPEIICSAVLMQEGTITSVTDSVEWMTEPPGGDFSRGTRGVFYLVDEKSDVKIFAEYKNDTGETFVSPKLTLSWP